MKTLSDGFKLIDFETDIIVLGALAIYRAQLDPDCPVRHWMGDVNQDTLRLNNDRYRFGPYRHKIDGEYVNGIRMRKDIGHYDGKSGYVEIFFPWAAMKDVNVSIRGLLLEQSAPVPEAVPA